MTEQITYQWTISALECAVSKDELTNVVETIHWRYAGTDENGNIADNYGSESVGDPNPDQFTPFQELTLEVVSQWLEQIINMEELKLNIKNQINEIKNPSHVTLQLPSESAEPDQLAE